MRRPDRGAQPDDPTPPARALDDLAGTPRTRALLLTPALSGAIAAIEVVGEAERTLAALASRREWPIGRFRLVRVAEIDDAVAVRLSERVALIMPHGGPRIVQRLLDRLRELGTEIVAPEAVAAQDRFPEASDDLEATMLEALSRAESPLAIDLLLDQPRRWAAAERPPGAEDLARAARLERLMAPPCVALVGPPNVGKSTLTNRLAGRDVAIVADAPGTTRDAVLCTLVLDGLAVRWFDTPGVRRSEDPLEQEAIAMADGIVRAAACVVAVADGGSEWPRLERDADLRVATRCDLGRRADAQLHVSAVTGEGIEELAAAIRERLVPRADLDHPGPWWLGRTT